MKLETYFPYKLASTAEAFSRRLVEVYRRTYGLSREEWRMLLLLADAGQLTSLELAKRTTLDKVQVSRAATRLEDKGLIGREVACSDRRLRSYTCTELGKNLFDRAFPAVQNCSEAILGKLTQSDMTKLDEGLTALQRAIEEYASEQADPAN